MIVDLDDHLRLRSAAGPSGPASGQESTHGRRFGDRRGCTDPGAAAVVAVGVIAVAAICVVAAIGTYLTAPRPGGRMDPPPPDPRARMRW